MRTPQIPLHESERLAALLSYKILDSHPEKDFDDITRLASEICDTPISVITLLDENRQWFKSKIGLDLNETPRDVSFCAHAINTPRQNFIVENTLEDERFADNPFVTNEPGVRSYAGVPLVDPDGHALGTLCVIDNRVKRLEEYQIKALEKLAGQAMKLLELRKNNFKLAESHNLLLERYKELEQFSSVVSHDLKSPLGNIMMLTRMLDEEYADKLDDNGKQLLAYIGQSAEELRKLVDGILEYYKYDTIDLSQQEKIRLHELTKYVIALLNEHQVEFTLPDIKIRLFSNKIALGQILFNLITNAVKYNDKENPSISIGFSQTETENIIFVKDNGMGIPESQFEKIFGIFETLGKTDRFNRKGTGIGLSTVQKLVIKLGGRIEIKSQAGIGTTFYIHLKK